MRQHPSVTIVDSKSAVRYLLQRGLKVVVHTSKHKGSHSNDVRRQLAHKEPGVHVHRVGIAKCAMFMVEGSMRIWMYQSVQHGNVVPTYLDQVWRLLTSHVQGS